MGDAKVHNQNGWITDLREWILAILIAGCAGSLWLLTVDKVHHRVVPGEGRS